MGVADCGQDGMVTKDFLNIENADAGFDQVRGIAVPPMSSGT
jgi:hypothetical protein